MALRFVLDENLRGPLWQAIRSHNLSGGLPIDAVRVGAPPAPPLGALDPDVIRWAAADGRVLISIDRQTMIADFLTHTGSGATSPGLMIVRPWARYAAVVAFLELAAHAGDPADFADRVTFIP